MKSLRERERPRIDGSACVRREKRRRDVKEGDFK